MSFDPPSHLTGAITSRKALEELQMRKTTGCLFGYMGPSKTMFTEGCVAVPASRACASHLETSREQ